MNANSSNTCGLIGKFLISLIVFYQKKISVNTRPRCRFVPTCSNYAIGSIKKYGAFKGLFLSIFRVLRCNPLFKCGYDPVPEKRK